MRALQFDRSGSDPDIHTRFNAVKGRLPTPSSPLLLVSRFQRGMQQLLFPDQGDRGSAGVRSHDCRHPFEVFSPCPITLPLGDDSHPRHDVRTSGCYPLNGDLMRFRADTPRSVRNDRDVQSFAERVDSRHRKTDLGPQCGHDQLASSGALHSVDDVFILPRVKSRSVDWLLLWKHLLQRGNNMPAPRG